ncbi:MAG: hypothetical protein VKK04_12865 [Synechococcales bacterium]|nr:hypothetical protein [Synechococcales bacterium]
MGSEGVSLQGKILDSIPRPHTDSEHLPIFNNVRNLLTQILTSKLILVTQLEEAIAQFDEQQSDRASYPFEQV